MSDTNFIAWVRNIYCAKLDRSYNGLDFSNGDRTLTGHALAVTDFISSKAAEVNANTVPASLTCKFFHDPLASIFFIFEGLAESRIVGKGDSQKLLIPFWTSGGY